MEENEYIALLKSIVEGVGAEVGEDFFRSVVQHLAEALGARYAFIGKSAETGNSIETIAFCRDGLLIENFSYEVDGTNSDACADKLCYCSDPTRSLLPNAGVQKRFGVKSCWGYPLKTSLDETIGVLVVMHDDNIRRSDQIIPIMKIFAARTASELERTRIEQLLRQEREALRRHRDELEETVRQRTADLEVARDKALAASAAKSRFLATMSHELRTPLNAIIGYSQFLEEEAVALNLHGFVADLGHIGKAGQHLLHLINDILDLSRVESGKMSIMIDTFDLAEVVYEVVDSIKPMADAKGNRLTVHCASDIGSIQSDATKVRQILLNLLNNACKFTEAGEISVRVQQTSRMGLDRVVIEIADTGIGITEEQKSKLFESFQQGDDSSARKYPGAGLGLAISRHFCTLLGGRIEMQSEPGKGSIFKVILPIAAARITQIDTPQIPISI